MEIPRSRPGTRLATILACAAAAGCGGEPVEEDEPALNPEIPLNQVLENPGRYDAVTVSATASPLGDLGFIASDASASIFVEAEETAAERIEDGEQVRVTATVERLDRDQAARLGRELESGQGDDDRVDERALADTRIGAGAPYLDLIHLTGADG